MKGYQHKMNDVIKMIHLIPLYKSSCAFEIMTGWWIKIYVFF